MFKVLNRLFRSRPRDVDDILPNPAGRRYYREQHNLRRELMDADALKVVNRLNRNGFRSYLVGGCVRDMLLKRHPKDFDVVTNATPTEIRNLFSNSRAIGRRFKIVHVVFRGKIIEVSTFRSLPSHRLSGEKLDKDLMLKRDNVFGTPKEDAARRDFTINALYFDPRNESVIDYVNGFQDIQNRRLAIIGDPNISFSEDPVRMLRAAKFAALLDFEMDPACLRAIKKNRAKINQANPSRLLEEYNKIFRTGRAFRVFASLYDSGLLRELFSESWDARIVSERSPEFEDCSLGRRIAVADKMLKEREDLTVNIFMALLLADLVRDILEDRVENNIVEYIKARILPACRRLNLPKKDVNRLIQIFASQPRFSQTKSTRRFKPEFFRKKIFFFEAFMLYKINAISNNNEEAMQKAMFWEIGQRPLPPEKGKVITLFGGRKKGNRARPGPSGPTGGPTGRKSGRGTRRPTRDGTSSRKHNRSGG